MVDITKENTKLREEVEDITRELKYLTLQRRKAEEAADRLLERNNILEEQNAILLCRIQDLEDSDMRKENGILTGKLLKEKEKRAELEDRLYEFSEEAAKFTILKAIIKFLDDEEEDILALASNYRGFLDMSYEEFRKKYFDDLN